MDISKFVQLCYSGKHLTDVELRMLFFKYPGIIEESTKVSSWHIFHCQVYMLRVLKGIQQANEPRRLGCSQYITFHENVPDLKIC